MLFNNLFTLFFISFVFVFTILLIYNLYNYMFIPLVVSFTDSLTSVILLFIGILLWDSSLFFDSKFLYLYYFCCFSFVCAFLLVVFLLGVKNHVSTLSFKALFFFFNFSFVYVLLFQFCFYFWLSMEWFETIPLLCTDLVDSVVNSGDLYPAPGIILCKTDQELDLEYGPSDGISSVVSNLGENNIIFPFFENKFSALSGQCEESSTRFSYLVLGPPKAGPSLCLYNTITYGFVSHHHWGEYNIFYEYLRSCRAGTFPGVLQYNLLNTFSSYNDVTGFVLSNSGSYNPLLGVLSVYSLNNCPDVFWFSAAMVGTDGGINWVGSAAPFALNFNFNDVFSPYIKSMLSRR